MLQSIDKKNKYILLIITYLLLTTINNTNFINNKIFSTNVKSVEVVGLNENLNLQIQERLNYIKNSNIFYINKDLFEKEINKYNFIESFKVYKFYPKNVILKINQTNFLATTIRNNKKYIIGSNGKLIEYGLFKNNNNLPLIFGNFNNKDFLIFKKKIDQSSFKYSDIKNFFSYPSKRWDIKTIDNLLIKLPINDVELALERAKKITESKKFNNNIIDLRITNQIILPNE